MAIPTARVKIEFTRILGVRAVTLPAGDTRYARAFAFRMAAGGPEIATGRSRPIPNTGGTFDLSTEAVPWVFEFDLGPSDDISIRVDVAFDNGIAGVTLDAVLLGTVVDPWTPG